MADIDDIVREFLVESFEGLDQLDGELLTLESNPGDAATLQSIFRTIHSIKGASGFLEFATLERVTHAGENLLDALREGKIGMNEVLASALLELNDAVRSILSTIESTGTDETADQHGGLITRLTELLESGGTSGADATVQESTSTNEPTPGRPPAEEDSQRESNSSVADSSIRLRVDQLDALMNLAGELVLARNQILLHTTRLEDAPTHATAQRLSRITSELQEGIMKIRMQPIGLLWNRLPRVVRDLAHQLDKEVELVMEGTSTELDKTLLEAIKDPLTHLVRNSLDHGIESPVDRESAGKDRKAKLTLSAFHESGQVNIVVADDGRGIDPDVIRAKAVERGLVSESEARQIDDRAALELLFRPGFSTASEVTNVSGRGVGMDVVRSNLERVGGTVEIESQKGEGTRVVVRIPLTLAIIPVLTVHTGGQRYAIPQVNLVELVRAEGAGDSRIQHIQGQPVFRLRGRLLPLVDLNDQLGVESQSDEQACSIVVVHANGRPFGLVVDSIHETEEIVVKPMDRQVKGLPVYAGTTILGDGRVALILDVAGIGQRAQLLDEQDLSLDGDDDTAARRSEASDEYVVFVAGSERRMAIELADVDRLEELDPTSIERAGTLCVAQYRGDILPLVDLSAARGDAPILRHEGDPLRVIVRTDENGSLGLVVDEIVDVVDVAHDAPRRTSPESCVESIVVANGCVTELLDIEWFRASIGSDPAGATTFDATGSTTAAVGAQSNLQLCTFRLAGGLYGIDVLEVQEVLRPQGKTPIPLAPDEIDGLINLRGETVILVDLRLRLGLETLRNDVDEQNQMNIVLRTSEGVVSVLVDEVGEVLELPTADFENCPPSLDDRMKRLAHGVFKLESDLLLQLDVEAIARDANENTRALAGAESAD